MFKPLQNLATAAGAIALLATVPTVQAAPVAGQGTWETTLQARDINGDGAVDAFFDSALNITWLADWNRNGPMSWYAATAWAGALDVHGVTGWRLPSTSAVADGSVKPDPASSEMAHMYYGTWGNIGYPDAGYGLVNTANFINVLNSTAYWSGTDTAADPDLAWYFYSFLGFQNLGGYTKDSPLYAVAVHDGDVPVKLPEPHSLALMALAAAGAAVARRGAMQRRG